MTGKMKEPARAVQREPIAVLAVGQHLAVERAADDRHAVGDIGRFRDVERQEDRPVGLDDELTGRIKAALRTALSPRHVPDEIHQVPGIPRTLSGKKLEVPVRKILLGTPVADAADPDALANPEVLAWFAR